MIKRIAVLLLAVLFALALPLAALAGQQPISGTPTWQNVPNLGEEYGYYWTDAEGDTIFVIYDQTTGQPTSIYLETVTTNTGYNTVTKTVTNTSMDTVPVNPPTLLDFFYPAAGWGVQTPPGGTYTVMSGDTSNEGYGVMQFQNADPFPVNVLVNCSVDYSFPREYFPVSPGSVSTTVTVPPGLWYVEVPLPDCTLLSAGGSNGWWYVSPNPMTISYVVTQACVQYVFGSDGNAYPLDGTSGTSPGTSSPAYYIENDDESPLTINAYPGYSVQGWGSIGKWQSGFVDEQKFVPTLNASVGELQDYSEPVELFTIVSSADVPPYVTLTDSTIHVTSCSYDWQTDSYQYTGYLKGTFTNNTPLQATITDAGSGSISFDNGRYQGISGTLSMPVGVTAPPNKTISVNIPISGTEDYPPGTYRNPYFTIDPTNTPIYVGSETLTSADGRSYAFYATTQYMPSGTGWMTGVFRTWNAWMTPSDNVVDSGTAYSTPYPGSTTLTVPVAFES